MLQAFFPDIDTSRLPPEEIVALEKFLLAPVDAKEVGTILSRHADPFAMSAFHMCVAKQYREAVSLEEVREKDSTEIRFDF